MPDFFNCDNKDLSVEDVFRLLICDDGSGNPMLNVNATVGSVPSVERTLVTTEHVGVGNFNIAAGFHMVMIVCEDGTEEINGVVHPSGLYVFEPQNGNDTLASITANPQTGRIIVNKF